jgi:hypothetical protein
MSDTETITLETLDTLEQGERCRIGFELAAPIPQGLYLGLLSLARRALEQEAKPVPVGVVTRGHREAVVAAAERWLGETVKGVMRTWAETGEWHGEDRMHLRMVESFSMAVAAAYERGKAERDESRDVETAKELGWKGSDGKR